jgi:hypothetical protein
VNALRLLLTTETPSEDLDWAFQSTEYAVSSGQRKVDPHAIDSFPDLIFNIFFGIPFFQIPLYLQRISVLQIHTALFLYPTYQLDFFKQPDDIVSVDSLRFAGFFSALGRGFVDPSHLSPVISYDFPAVQQAMYMDDS